MTIIGELRTEGDVRIDGHLCGNFNCAQLIVGRDADITGAIIAKEVVVRGKITGTIRASRVVLQDTAHVESEIVYKLLSIDEGARFEGVARCRPNPLQDEAAVSAMTELRRIKRMNGAADGTVSLLAETLNPMGESHPFHLADQNLRVTPGTPISAGAAIRSASAFLAVALNSWRNICHHASMPTWKSARWVGSAAASCSVNVHDSL